MAPGRPTASALTVLACPLCKAGITLDQAEAVCVGCQAHFPQPARPYIDLHPETAAVADRLGDAERQLEMEAWYDRLVEDVDQAVAHLFRDYEPFKDVLARLDGVVIDVGGGLGVPERFLRDSVQYVCIDPSTDWFEKKWEPVRARLIGPEPRALYVRGIGERLPVASGAADAVLAFWSLNHVAAPGQVVNEIRRALRPNGFALLVLEDMIPTRSDVLARVLQSAIRLRLRHALRTAQDLLPWVRARWPLQADHVRIRERAMSRWMAPDLKVVSRTWHGTFLALQLTKVSDASQPH